MLSFKTRYTSVEIGETVKISRKGKNSLETAYDYTYIDGWDFYTTGGYIRVGAYIIHLDVTLEERLISLINAYMVNPNDYQGDTTIQCKTIKIQEL